MPFLNPIGLVAGLLKLAKRRLLPTSLDSEGIRKLSKEVKDSALFSSKIENALALQKVQNVVLKVVGGATPESEAASAAGTGPKLLSIPDAKRQIEEEFRRLGVGPEDPRDIGTIKDPTSDRRLQLIVQTQEAMAHGYGRYAATQDTDVLDMWPAWELVRVSPVLVPRGFKMTQGGKIVPKPGDAWPARWKKAGGELVDGRMVALKNADVWKRLGDSSLFPDGLGNPYPPFAFSSGMDVKDIKRSEAEKLGLLSPNAPAPAPVTRNFNEDLQASALQFDSALLAALDADPNLELQGGVLRLAGE